MLKTIDFKGKIYPAHQATGNAARFALAFAQEVLQDCKTVYDIGPSNRSWAYPKSIMIDPAMNEFSATKFPTSVPSPDGLFSSHVLEHLPDWVAALDYWHSQLLPAGIVFLYLPHHAQEYWRPHHNRKHLHSFTPEIIRAYFEDQPEKWRNVMVTEGWDLNHSFYAVAEKTTL